MYKAIALLICIVFGTLTTVSFFEPNIVIDGDTTTVSECSIEEEESTDLYLHKKTVEPTEIELLSVLVMAEAEGEPDDGKRLVIDTVLNRVDSDRYPDNIYDVIYQPNQFTSVWNGRFDRCNIDCHCCELITEELRSRTNYDCVYFNAGHYSDYGVPMFSVCNHYFSSEEGDD